MSDPVIDEIHACIDKLEKLVDANQELSVMLISTFGSDPNAPYDFNYFFQGDGNTIVDALVNRMVESVNDEDGYVYNLLKDAVELADEILLQQSGSRTKH